MNHNELSFANSASLFGSDFPLEGWYSDWTDLKAKCYQSRKPFLPIYLLVDISHDAQTSSLGPALARFKLQMKSEAFMCHVWLWIIPFSNTAPVLFPRQNGALDFDWPAFRPGGVRRLDLALAALRESIKTDIPDDKQARPCVPQAFVFLDGYPEDEQGRRSESWRMEIEQLKRLRYYHRPHMYSFAARADIDHDFLTAVGGEGAYCLSEFTGWFPLQFLRHSVEIIAPKDDSYPFGSFSPGPDGLVKIP